MVHENSDMELMSSARMFRGEREPVSTLLSALGKNREVHLTAYLAYLIKLNPSISRHLFSISFQPDEVFVEKKSQGRDDRYDIILQNGKQEVTIEAKIGFHSVEQIKRYLAKKRNLILLGEGFGKFYSSKAIKGFVNWDELDKKLTTLSKREKEFSPYLRGLMQDYTQHLREQGMSKPEYKDIYTRDLSGNSVQLFFEHQIYTCQKANFNTASKCRYFAPYLTNSNKQGKNKSLYHILGVGITYFSKIKEAMLVNVKDISKILKKNGYSDGEIRDIKKLMYEKEKECSLFILDTPLRISRKPITKKDFWGHSGGAMPSMGIDFGDLMAAANGLHPLKKSTKKKAA